MTWTIVHPTFTMTGTGVSPYLVADTPPPQPPVTPPPVSVPPPAPPARGPYPWPDDPGPRRGMFDYERASGRWSIPGRREDDPRGTIYATLPSFGYPSLAVYNAGLISSGRFQGYRIWAPSDAPHDMLWAIAEGRLA